MAVIIQQVANLLNGKKACLLFHVKWLFCVCEKVPFLMTNHVLIVWLAAEEVLAQLTDQLTRRKAQLQDAGDKLVRLQQAIDDQVLL